MKRSGIKRKPPKKRKQKTDRAKSIERLDTAARTLCKERVNWVCEWCGRDCSESRRSLHWSHIFSRRHHRIRWSPINCAAHCATCHRRWHESPVEGGEWFGLHCETHWQGPYTKGLLEELKQKPAKYTTGDLEDMVVHYEAEVASMAERRAQGDTGRIEWEAWD